MKLVLGLPLDDGHKPEFWRSCELVEKLGIELTGNPIQRIYNSGDGICRARNSVANGFLKTDGTHLLFIDTDLDFPPGNIKRLIEYARENPRAIVCGQYPLKKPELRFVWNKIPDQNTQIEEGGWLEVAECGTGVMMIPRELLLEYAQHVGNYKCDYDGTRKYEFFAMGIKDDRYLSEDYWFCYQMRHLLNVRIMVDVATMYMHIGTIKYPMSVEQIIGSVTSRIYSRKDLKHWYKEIYKDYKEKVRTNLIEDPLCR